MVVSKIAKNGSLATSVPIFIALLFTSIFPWRLIYHGPPKEKTPLAGKDGHASILYFYREMVKYNDIFFRTNAKCFYFYQSIDNQFQSLSNYLSIYSVLGLINLSFLDTFFFGDGFSFFFLFSYLSKKGDYNKINRNRILVLHVSLKNPLKIYQKFGQTSVFF